MSDAHYRPRKKTRQENADETRQALLRAALGVVARHGYKKSSVARITEAAGVAQGTLYSYFDSHDKLLAELVPAAGAELVKALKRAANGATSYLDYEQRIFVAFAAYLRKSPHLLRVLTEAEIATPSSHAAFMQAIQEMQLEALHRARNAAEIRPQSERAFRAIAEILAGARNHIAIGFGDPGEKQVFRPDRVPPWAAATYTKFIARGLDGYPTFKFEPSRSSWKKREPPRRDMRSHLLESGARLIYEVGFAGASVQAITRAANVALATFYAYFLSRQAYFDELLTYVRATMLAHVRERARGSGSFLELECRGFYVFFDYLWRNPWYIRIETEAALWAPTAYLHHFHDLADRYVASMRRSKANGELAAYEDHELPVIAFILMAARHYLANRFVLTNPKPHHLPSWVGESYVRFIAEGLRDAGARPPAARRR